MQTNTSNTQLQDALAKLPREKQPERDLWTGIELALEQSEQVYETSSSKRPVWIASAASFALVAMLGWIGFQQFPSNTLPEQSAALVQSLSEQHQYQKDTLLVKYEGQVAISDDWQQQLQELDDAADAIKTALDQDPANPALIRMLHHTYQQQLALIERVHAPKWQQI